MSRVKVAAIQTSPNEHKAANLNEVAELIQEATREGAQIVALQELFSFRGNPAEEVNIREPIPGPTTAALGEMAQKNGIYLVAGSMLETIPESSKSYNTCVVFNPHGEIIGKYRKIHLFGIQTESEAIWEGKNRDAGHEVVCVETSYACLGLSICYDLRFPELYRRLVLAGAQIIFVPAAFLIHTGRDHWDVLLRARAIETQSYVVAPNCIGRNAVMGTVTCGRSMIIDPWGNIVAQASDQPGYTMATLDLSLVDKVRKTLPTVANRRLG